MHYKTQWSEFSSATDQVLFCDLQKEMVKHSKTTRAQALASAASARVQLANLFALPSITSVVPEGPNPPQLIAELSENAGSPQMMRTTASLFGNAHNVD
jgi:hypothetical protein